MTAIPLDRILYEKVVKEAKQKFKTYPSAYASGWIVRRYKELGGKYKGDKEKSTSLDRWFKEKWINVCKLPKIVPCGRKQASEKDYPYCRPLKRINKNTPKTVNELTPEELKRRCSIKKKIKEQVLR